MAYTFFLNCMASSSNSKYGEDTLALANDIRDSNLLMSESSDLPTHYPGDEVLPLSKDPPLLSELNIVD